MQYANPLPALLASHMGATAMCLGSCTYVGGMEGILGSRLQTNRILIVVVIWGVN